MQGKLAGWASGISCLLAGLDTGFGHPVNSGVLLPPHQPEETLSPW